MHKSVWPIVEDVEFYLFNKIILTETRGKKNNKAAHFEIV